MKLDIDNRDLHFTIDTYAMFTGESVEESEVEYYSDEYQIQPQDVSFEYDHAGIVESLAHSSINILHNELVVHGDGTILSIELKKTRSPQFYNYTTDSYIAEWEVDGVKLLQYARENKDEWQVFKNEEWSHVEPCDIEDDGCTENEDLLTALVDFYTSRMYDSESYNLAMWECETEAYYENMELSKETQKLLNAKNNK